mgnify:FL=1|tara:strand:+ start:461 stop:967 length:507 start_codon:yes stop_codon:yes gene_type:complete
MSNLKDEERLQLDKMIKSYGADDNTEKIRTLKHSKKIKEDVERLINLKRKYARMELTNKDGFEKLLISHCNFLWTHYTNIFNRIIKNELNIRIFDKFVEKLKEIEDGITDQHEASVEIGKILKELYIDSALRKEKNYETQENGGKPKKEKKPVNNISWAKFKAMGLNE